MLELFFSFLAQTNDIRAAVQDLWSISLLAACLVWGGGPEKLSIAFWIVIISIGNLIESLVFPDDVTGDIYWSVEPISFSVDTALFIAFLAIALTANRRYVFWVAAFQTIAFMAHVLRAFVEEMTPFTYLFLTVGAGYLQLVAITLGLVAHIRREPNRYADWKWQIASNR